MKFGLQRLEELEATGVNYVRVNCADREHQARVAKHVLPRLAAVRV
jgi:hypothetical protein